MYRLLIAITGSYLAVMLLLAAAALGITLWAHLNGNEALQNLVSDSILHTAAALAVPGFIGGFDMFFSIWQFIRNNQLEEERRAERRAEQEELRAERQSDRKALETEREESRKAREEARRAQEAEREEARKARDAEQEERRAERAEARRAREAEQEALRIEREEARKARGGGAGSAPCGA